MPPNSSSSQLFSLLISALNSRSRSPAHVGVSGFDRLETGDVTFSVSQLFLPFSSASAFCLYLHFIKNVAQGELILLFF